MWYSFKITKITDKKKVEVAGLQPNLFSNRDFTFEVYNESPPIIILDAHIKSSLADLAVKNSGQWTIFGKLYFGIPTPSLKWIL